MARDLLQREHNFYVPTLDREDLNRISEILKTCPRDSEASSAVPGGEAVPSQGLGDTLEGHLWESDICPQSFAQFRKETNCCNYIIYKWIGEDAGFYAGLNCEREQSLSEQKRKKRWGVLKVLTENPNQ